MKKTKPWEERHVASNYQIFDLIEKIRFNTMSNTKYSFGEKAVIKKVLLELESGMECIFSDNRDLRYNKINQRQIKKKTKGKTKGVKKEE